MDSRVKRFIITIAILGVLGGIFTAWINIYPDFLWFDMVKYLNIYTKILSTKILIGLMVGVVYLAILLGNLYIVYRLTPAHLSPAFMGGTEFTGGRTSTRKMIYGGLTLLAFLFSILMGYSATDRWEIFLRYTHADNLNFQTATPIIVEDSLNSTAIPVSKLELEAKKIQIDDEVTVHIGEETPTAKVVAILDATRTPITLNDEESLDSNEIPVTRSDLDAKHIQVGDLVKVHVDELVQTAKILEIQEDVMRLDTQVQIESGQTAFFTTSSGLRLDTEIPIESGQKAYFTSLARDPIFNNNISYYVFKMPMERYIIGTLFGIFLLVTIFAAVIYFFHGLITGETNQMRFQPPVRVKAHLFTLVGLTLLFRCLNYRFAMFDLLYTSNDVVRGGGGYAAINARLPILWIMLVITAVCAIVLIINIFIRRNTYAFAGFAIFLVAGFLGQVYPRLIQNWRVEPNKQVFEQKFINYNIKATLNAYGLESNTVTEEEYPITETLSYANITSPENEAVINSIRLWDWRPLRRTFRQLQEIRSQYDFFDVDIDRYTVNDDIQQVMLSARELNINELPDAVKNDWYKQTYTYTHGYGAVVSPVDEIDNGSPNMYVKGLPPIEYQTQWPHRFDKDPGPRIYYGERTDRYVIVHPQRTELKLEFDYPQKGEQYVDYAYQGTGGVQLSSFWRKLVYMLKFNNEIKFVLPGEIDSESKVLYERNIKKRIRKIAPFLRYDGDPYAVIHDGKLIWMIDAYTITHRYPYSVSMEEFIQRRRQQGPTSQRDGRPWGNYIRNSVKVVVDAYDGTVEFYVIDQEQDPIIECYRKIFPDLFKSFDEMPADLKTHIRYPTTMFLIQSRVYQDYHMKEPITFYAGEDQWEIGTELYDNTDTQTRQTPQQTSPLTPQRVVKKKLPGNVQPVEPYYVILKLPGEEKAEFMLMLPFTPRNKPNLIAWLGARCDLPQYGQLLVYRFPKQALVPGPMQVENYISQKPEISQQISLWNTEGTRVLRGNLLIMPINNSLLYVEPIYIQSEDEDTAIPELRRVVVGYKEIDNDNPNIVWGETLDEALREMFLNRVGPQSDRTTTVDVTLDATELPEGVTSLSGLIEQASNYYNNLQDSQRNGNWAEYGQNLELLGKTLKQLEENTKE